MTSTPAGDWIEMVETEALQTDLAPGYHGDLRRLVTSTGRHLVLAPAGTEAGLGPTYLEQVRQSPPRLARWSQRATIRALDIVGAVVGLTAMLPVLLAVTVLISLTSDGPVLFRHARVGRQGQPFSCLKFRSMHVDADDRLRRLLAIPEWRSQWEDNRKLRNDPRVTSIGRYLRRFDLDELPQLWNVLRGEMSLVGPRPVVEDEAERYGARLSTVLSVKPGLTGLWQISGRNDLPYEERVVLDSSYVAVQSALVNLALVARTAWLLIVRRNEPR